MKCPKCGYLGFEEVERCKNCGYEFSLTASSSVQELSLRDDKATLRPLDDLELVDAASSSQPSRAGAAPTPSFEAPTGRSLEADELPLFGFDAGNDQPMITRASPPRQPLAVRRATPEVPRLRATPPRAPMLDLGDDAAPRASSRAFQQPALSGRSVSASAAASEPAGIPSRITAVAIDVAMLLAIDAAVIYFTMQIGSLTLDELRQVSKGPLLAFLLLQNGGYLVVFTIGGQTLGKMATGIKVVSAESGDSLAFGQSVVRTLVWLVLAIPAGLGLLTALISPDRRGLHDRCAGTKVVRASA